MTKSSNFLSLTQDEIDNSVHEQSLVSVEFELKTFFIP